MTEQLKASVLIGEQPAFPFPSGPEPRVDEFHDRCEGMSYRQWLAGMALQGLLARPLVAGDATIQERAQTAVMYADALIAELSKPNAQLDP